MKHWREVGGPVHCESADGVDYTLCGYSMDGESGLDFMKETAEGIDCQRCINMINFCKRVRSGEIKAAFERRRA